jgi:hypothetical protein
MMKFLLVFVSASFFFGVALAAGEETPAFFVGKDGKAEETNPMIRRGLSTATTISPPKNAVAKGVLLPPRQRSRQGGTKAIAEAQNKLFLEEAKELHVKLSGLMESFDDSISSIQEQGDLDGLPFDFVSMFSSVKEHTLIAEESVNNLVAVLDGKIHGGKEGKEEQDVLEESSQGRHHRRRYLNQDYQSSWKQDRSSSSSGSWGHSGRQTSSSTLHEAIMNGDMRFFETHFHHSPHFARMKNRAAERHPHGRDLALASSSKRDQCELLVSCTGPMTFYDIIVFFYQDDIDFEKGELDESKKISRKFDDQDLEKKKSQIVGATLSAKQQLTEHQSAEGFGAAGDACDLLLAEFHQVVESDDGDRWYPGNVTSVCLAEGTTKYLKLNEIKTKIGAPEVDAVFNDFVVCTKQLYANDPLIKVHFPQEGNLFYSGAGSLQMPLEVNDDVDTIRDEHGEIKDDMVDPTKFFKMKVIEGQFCFLSVSISMKPWC